MTMQTLSVVTNRVLVTTDSSVLLVADVQNEDGSLKDTEVA